MVGWMKSLDLDSVTKAESNPISTTEPNSGDIHFTDNAGFVDPDPGHSFEAVYEQVFGRPWTADSASSSEPLRPTMDGFAQQAEEKEKGLSETVMKGLRPEAVPITPRPERVYGMCNRRVAYVQQMPSLIILVP